MFEQEVISAMSEIMELENGGCFNQDEVLKILNFYFSDEVSRSKRMKEQLREAKDRYDRAADKTPIRACGAEYRLFCDIERILEDWGAEDD